MSNDRIPIDPSWQQNAVQEIFDKLVIPEINRRQAAGSAIQLGSITGFQVIFRIDGAAPMVRLNEEVRAIAIVRLDEGAAPSIGQEFHQGDGEIIGYRLHDDEGDLGHFTVIWDGQNWIGGFNFVYNRAAARRLAVKAKEFHEAAKLCLERGLLGPCADTLFSAAELAAKVKVICTGQFAWAKKRVSHQQIKTRFNLATRDGQVPGEHSGAFNRLMKERPSARYGDGASRLGQDELRSCLREVGEMVNDADRWTAG